MISGECYLCFNRPIKLKVDGDKFYFRLHGFNEWYESFSTMEFFIENNNLTKVNIMYI